MKHFKMIVLVIMLMMVGSKASNYNNTLLELHKNMANFRYDFHAMPSGGDYRLIHADKHFNGKKKPLPSGSGESGYGRRNSAAIVSIITTPNEWELCDATDSYAHKLGLWNDSMKLFMVFGYVSQPIKGQEAGVLVSAYVEKQGKRKLRCDWDEQNYEEFNELKTNLRDHVPHSSITLEEVAKPIALGAIVAGILVTGEELAKFLAFITLGSV